MQSLSSHFSEVEFQVSAHDQQMIDSIDNISQFLESQGFPVASFSEKAATKFST